MKVKQVTLQAPATNTTQDFTSSTFGTAQAAIIIASRSGNSGSWGADTSFSIGFWDGSVQQVMSAGWDDGGNPGTAGDSNHMTNDAFCVRMSKDNTSIGERDATVSGTVTDGIELTWTGTDTGVRPQVTVILINGINGAAAGFRTVTQTVDVATTTTCSGVTPKLILFAGRRSNTEDGSGTEPGIMYGYAADNGSTYDQGYVTCRNRSGQDPTDCAGSISNTYAMASDISFGGVGTGRSEVTDMSAGSFDTTLRINTATLGSHNYLALDFDEDIIGFDAATPTASGDWDPFTSSFTPQWVFMYPTSHAALDTGYGAGEDGQQGFGFYSVNADGEEDGHYATMEDGTTGAGNMIGDCKHDTDFECVTSVSGTPTERVDGNSPTFDASGIVYADANFNHNTTARQVIGFAVAEAAAGTSSMMMRMLHEGHL